MTASQRALAQSDWLQLQRCATPVVIETLQCLTQVEIERIVERGFRDVRARWEDRASMWDMLLQGAVTGDIRLSREFNLRALQLLADELL